MSGVFLSLGAGAGIGLSTARRFAAEGYRVVLAARDATRLQALADELTQDSNAGVEIAIVDCADTRQVAALVDRYSSTLSVLHYNAAALRMQTLEQQPLSSIDEDITVDISSGLVAIKQAQAAMALQEGGTILLTGGVLAVQPMNEFLTLSVGKAGLRVAAQALFPVLKEQNIHITVLTIGTAIKPGSAQADAIAEAFWQQHIQPKEQWRWETCYGCE